MFFLITGPRQVDGFADGAKTIATLRKRQLCQLKRGDARHCGRSGTPVCNDGNVNSVNLTLQLSAVATGRKRSFSSMEIPRFSRKGERAKTPTFV
ncbi:MAG: hypothetical protein ACRYG4_12220 [Janthinobacterium lividum]